MFLFLVTPTYAWDINNKESVKEYLGYVASKEGVSVGLLEAIVKAESNFNKDAKNPVGTASGLLQYLDSTFRNYCINKYHLTDTMEDKNNPFIQTNCAVYMLQEEGVWRHWESSRFMWSYSQG